MFNRIRDNWNCLMNDKFMGSFDSLKCSYLNNESALCKYNMYARSI